jgi:6-phosphogluconolactonase
MDKPQIFISENPDALAANFSRKLIGDLQKIFATKSKATVGLSGGNTPKKVFEYIAKNLATSTHWHKTHFFWGDERCVPAESDESNYGEAKRLLFDKIDIPSGNLHPIRGENDPEDEAKRYAEELNNYLDIVDGIPRFDINILGLGDDGHTASIFPDQMELLADERWCAVAQHPLSKQKRVTLTGKVLNHAATTYFLIAGSNKARIVKEIIGKAVEAEAYPAFYIFPEQGHLAYCLDKEAARGL